MHTAPEPGFFVLCGTFQPQCRPAPIQRFRCRSCRKTFSIRTFKADYYDKRPSLNAEVLSRLCSGTGYRQTSREIGISLNGLYHKARKLNRHLKFLHDNLMGDFHEDAVFLFDELETFEACRSTSPVTVPILIEHGSMFIVDAKSGRIPPSGKMTAKRREKIAEWQEVHGKRPNESRQAVASVLATLREKTAHLDQLEFVTDAKKTYPKLLREAFGADRVVQSTVSSKRTRDTSNPLFRINLTNAIGRDRLARLHRRSWCVTKRREQLDGHLSMWIAFRNYHGNRFNKDRGVTPAVVLGFLPRALSKGELLSWRQDWGPGRSVHPLARQGQSVREFTAA